MKKCISFLLILLILVSCLPLSAAAEDNSKCYRHRFMLVTPGLPQYIKGYLQYDPQKAELMTDYPGYEPDGFLFPLASELFEGMYALEYTADNGLITFEYTLNPGFDREYYLECLDRISYSQDGTLAKREPEALHQLPLVDSAFLFYNGESRPLSCVLTEQVNADGTTLFKDEKRLGSSYIRATLDALTPHDDPKRDPEEHLNLFLTQYQLSLDEAALYEEFYKHYNADDILDWSLVRVKVDEDTASPAYYEFGNRILSAENSASPFTFNVGVYNAKRGRFFDITECDADDYPDMEAVWTELGDGRLIGDMDDDNSLTTADVVLIQRMLAGVQAFPESDLNPQAESNLDATPFFSDFDRDGDRTITDATMIQRFLIDLPHRTAEWSPYQEPTEPMREPDDLAVPRITGFHSLGKGVEISIGAVDGAEKYRVYFKNKNGNWEKMGETAGEPFLATNTVEVGKEYTYTVRCIKADLSEFTSDYDRTGWTYTYEPMLDTPHITRIEAATDGVKVTWDPVEGADLYRLYYQKDGWTKIVDTASTSWVHTAAQPGNSYTYTVRCLSQDGKGFASTYDPDGTSFRLESTPWLYHVETHTDGVCFTVGDAAQYDGPIAVYRKESSGWKRIDVVAAGDSFTDTDAQVGKTYTYTCRCLSEDGTFFVSEFNSSGWTQAFTLAECKPELAWFMYFDDGDAAFMPASEDKFGIPKYGIDIFYLDNYLGTAVVDASDPPIFSDELFKTHQYLKLYVIGLDENDQPITSYREDGYDVRCLQSADNLRVKKIGDRKYRFRWDKSQSEGVSYDFSLMNADEETYIDEDNTKFLYCDVDLSDYPEDDEWVAILWTRDDISYSHSVRLDFSELDFNSENE